MNDFFWSSGQIPDRLALFPPEKFLRTPMMFRILNSHLLQSWREDLMHDMARLMSCLLYTSDAADD